MDSGSVDKVSSGGNHGNTAVLELGGTEPEESLITSPVGEVQGIEVGEGSGGATNVIKTKGKLRASGLCRKSTRDISMLEKQIYINTFTIFGPPLTARKHKNVLSQMHLLKVIILGTSKELNLILFTALTSTQPA